jgi:hypothetical protein
MSLPESIPESIEELVAGDVILLDDITKMALFEDLVAEGVDPSMNQLELNSWTGRVGIRNLLRPAKFNGNIGNIQLVKMNDPFGRLFDARQRGWSFGGSRVSIPKNPTLDQEVRDSYRGFTFTADASSSGRGIIGQIQAELWFGLVSINRGIQTRTHTNGEVVKFKYNAKCTSSNGGASVRRIVTKPKIENETFLELDESSRRIGIEILRGNVLKPIITTMRQ